MCQDVFEKVPWCGPELRFWCCLGQVLWFCGPGRSVAKALLKAFFHGIRGPLFGHRNAPFLVRIWPVWCRRAAAFPRFGAGTLGPLFFNFPRMPSPARTSPAQPSPQPSSAQPSQLRPAQPSPALSPSLGAGLGLRFVSGAVWGLDGPVKRSALLS